MNTLEITIQREVSGLLPVTAVYQKDCDYSRKAYSHNNIQPDFSIQLRAVANQYQVYGKMLGELVFQGEVEMLFRHAQSESDPLRVLLVVDEPKLRDQRWERLFGPIGHHQNWGELNRYRRIQYSLYLPCMAQSTFPQPSKDQLKALVLIANPPENDPYQLEPFDEEAALTNIRAGLGEVPITYLGSGPTAEGPPSLNQLCRILLRGDHNLLHIMCHGSNPPGIPSGVLYFHNQSGETEPLTADQLIHQMARLSGNNCLPHFCFLAACDVGSPERELKNKGSLSHRLVRELGIPAVLAMTEKIAVEAAVDLYQPFYQTLLDSARVDTALNRALFALSDRDAAVPVLYGRLGDRALFSAGGRPKLSTHLIRQGICRLMDLAQERAPAYLDQLRYSLEQFRRAHENQDLQLETHHQECDRWCRDLTGIEFAALCIGKQPKAYDSRCPFPGFKHFDQTQSFALFGRETETQNALQRLENHDVLVVAGPQNSGKSSLIFAGLLPLLQKDDTHLKAIELKQRDGLPPDLALLPAKGMVGKHNSLVILDQFESLRHILPTRKAWEQFCEKLVEHITATPSLKLVIAVSQHEHKPITGGKGFRQIFGDNVLLLKPIESLSFNMVMQAESAGLLFDDDLPEILLNDLHDNHMDISIQQFLLLELWKRRRGYWLCREVYLKYCNIGQLLCKAAEAFYQNLSKGEQNMVRSFFVRLVQSGHGSVGHTNNGPMAKETLLQNLLPHHEEKRGPALNLLYRMARVPLVTLYFDEEGLLSTVEPAHSSLCNTWERPKIWLQEDERQLILPHIHHLSALWHKNQRAANRLPKWNEDLEAAIHLFHHSEILPSMLEEAFLEACLEAKKEGDATEERRRKNEKAALIRAKNEAEKAARTAEKLAEERKRNIEQEKEALHKMSRLHFLTLKLVVLLVIFLGAVSSLYVMLQHANNKLQSQYDRTQELYEQAKYSGSEHILQQARQALNSGRQDQAIAFFDAMGDLGFSPSQYPSAHVDLLRELRQGQPQLHHWSSVGEDIRTANFSEDGSLFLQAGDDAVYFQEVPSGQLIQRISVPRNRTARIFAEGRQGRFAILDTAGNLTIYHQNSDIIAHFYLPNGTRQLYFFSDNYLFHSDPLGESRVLDLSDGSTLVISDFYQGGQGLAFQMLKESFFSYHKTQKEQGTTLEQQARLQEKKPSFITGDTYVWESFSRGNTWCFAVGAGGRGELWHTDPGALHGVFPLPVDFRVGAAHFSPNADFLWVRDLKGAIRLYDLRPIRGDTWALKNETLGPTCFSDDGKILAGAFYNQIHLYQAEQARTLRPEIGKQWIKDVIMRDTLLLGVTDSQFIMYHSPFTDPPIFGHLPNRGTASGATMEQTILRASLSPSSRDLLVATAEGGLYYYKNLQDKELLIPESLNIPQNQVISAITWLSPNQAIVSTYSGNFYRLFPDRSRFEHLFQSDIDVAHLAFDPRNKQLFIALTSGELFSQRPDQPLVRTLYAREPNKINHLVFNTTEELLMANSTAGLEILSPTQTTFSILPTPNRLQIKAVHLSREGDDTTIHVITENGVRYQMQYRQTRKKLAVENPLSVGTVLKSKVGGRP